MWVLVKDKIDSILSSKPSRKSRQYQLPLLGNHYFKPKIRQLRKLIESIVSIAQKYLNILSQLLFPIKFCIQSTYQFFFFFYVTIPMTVFYYIWGKIFNFIEVVCRRNTLARKFLLHTSEIIKIGNLVWNKVKQATLYELITIVMGMIYELVISWIWPLQSSTRSTSFTELSQILALEDGSNSFDISIHHQKSLNLKHKKLSMYHEIPVDLFKASIKMKRYDSSSQDSSTKENTGFGVRSQDELNFESSIDDTSLDEFLLLNDADTPASFPPTPFSRAHVMNRSADRVTSVMFSARDKLRQDLQSYSKDVYSSQLAKEAKNKGYLAVFDSKKSSDNMVLSCGGHCANKIGENRCAISQSMLPIMKDAYVYFEYSLTVNDSQVPSCILGFSPNCSPHSTEEDKWKGFISINSKCQLNVGQNVYYPKTPQILQPGMTVGFLILMPGIDNDMISENKSEYETSIAVDSSNRKFTLAKNTSQKLSKSQTQFELKININGQNIEYIINNMEMFQMAIRQELNDFKCDVFPTICILSTNTRIWSRFCEADIFSREYQNIGLNQISRVYCIDGSLLLSDSDKL